MSKIEIGVIVSVVLAMISGALYIGKIDGRLSAIELDKDLKSIQEAKASAISEISEGRDESTKIIEESTQELFASLDELKTKITELNERIDDTDQELRNEIEAKIIESFSSFEIGVPESVGGSKCPDGTVMVSVPHQLDDGGARGYVGRMQPSCASLTISFD